MSARRARRAIRDRWVPGVLRVTLVLALVVGLGGLALGSYALSGRQLVGQAGPSLAVPLASSAAAGDGTASPPPQTASTTVAGDPSQQPTPSTSAASPTTASPAQARATSVKVTAKSVPSTATTAASSSAASSATPTTASNASTYEQQVLTLTNEQRAAAGCPALTWNSTLAAVARAHSQDMAANNYFDHNTPSGATPDQRFTAAGYRYTHMAENIAAGQATPADVMASWMASAGHKANILSCGLTELGVGYATGGTYGSYWTQDFGAR